MIKARRVKYDTAGRFVGKSKPVDVWCCHNDPNKKSIEVYLGLNKQGWQESVYISLKDLLNTLGKGCGHFEGKFQTHGKY